LAFFNRLRNPTVKKYKLIIVNNRDEDLDRPTSALAWEEGVLAGRDLESPSRGTWFGMNRLGRIGILLSITESEAKEQADKFLPNGQARPSRGTIPMDWLKSEKENSLDEFMKGLKKRGEEFAGFQFLGMERDTEGNYRLGSLTNRLEERMDFWPEGIYGFGNSPYPLPFRKVVHGENLLKELIHRFDFQQGSEEDFIEELLTLAKNDETFFPDPQIRLQKGISPPPNGEPEDESYRYLCSIFVQKSIYGTRSQSIVLVDMEDRVTFYQSRMLWDEQGTGKSGSEAKWETTKETFRI